MHADRTTFVPFQPGAVYDILVTDEKTNFQHVYVLDLPGTDVAAAVTLALETYIRVRVYDVTGVLVLRAVRR